VEIPLRFGFRPWVRRAGLSILIIALGVTVSMAGALFLSARGRHGWLGEPFAWLYVAALWGGGIKVYFGTFKPLAEVTEETLLLRPLHTMAGRLVEWNRIRGTEQMIRGDRLILYYDEGSRTRQVALNLNLVRGRREFLKVLDERLYLMGFSESLVGESRYLSRQSVGGHA